MSASGFSRTPGGWEWPADLPARPESTPRHRGPNASPKPTPTSSTSGASGSRSQANPPRQRHYGPKTCRICFETVLPTFHPPSENLPGIFQGAPSVTYESEDGGRLVRPCKCKGSQKYVHEGCLQAWRHADPGYGRRNYWQCPTCGFKYRLQRLGWGRLISSVAAQIGLTITVLVLTMFLLGFIADPIINIYMDPYSTIFSPLTGSNNEYYYVDEDEASSWSEHFLKGFASLGLLSFVKVIITSPWQWWHLRSSSFGGGRNATSGRDRLQNISWLVVMIGVATFLYAVWKGVRAWSRRTLEKAGEKVMDVQVDDDDDEEFVDDPAAASASQ